jgi:hypothetical protein
VAGLLLAHSFLGQVWWLARHPGRAPSAVAEVADVADVAAVPRA